MADLTFMLDTQTNASEPISSRDELVAYLERGVKPRERWAIGTEHEKFGFLTDSLAPLPYDGERSVRAVLAGLRDRFGWSPIEEAGKLIALGCPSDKLGGSITLEPGGQFELSGAPLKTVHDTCREVNDHLDQVRAVAQPLGIGFLGVGFSPKWSLDDTPVMPKGRYRIMRDYMAKTGTLGREMMFQTATVQVNLDFSSEADMVKKFRVSLALQPIATALFANSPFRDGVPNGFLSFRSHIWLNLDDDRTGMLDWVFDDGFGFEAYADYALGVPMYFVKRGETYHNAAGLSFRDFLDGKLEILPGERPSLIDWSDHLTTLFPEVRMKQFLEMRGADGGPWRSLCALPALWVGLLYDDTSLDAAWDLVKSWTSAERQQLRDQVPVSALETPFRSGTVLDIAREMLDIAHAGLERRNKCDIEGRNEAHFLDVVEQTVASGKTPAQVMLEKYAGGWNHDIDQVFGEYAY